jgi:hypothetical protein
LNELSSLHRFSLLDSRFSGTLKKSYRKGPLEKGGGYTVLGSYGAGIGSGYSSNGASAVGSITIDSGIVNATSHHSAGIGSGSSRDSID